MRLLLPRRQGALEGDGVQDLLEAGHRFGPFSTGMALNSITYIYVWYIYMCIYIYVYVYLQQTNTYISLQNYQYHFENMLEIYDTIDIFRLWEQNVGGKYGGPCSTPKSMKDDIRMHVYICIYTRLYVCIYIYIHTHVCSYLHVYICVHILTALGLKIISMMYSVA